MSEEINLGVFAHMVILNDLDSKVVNKQKKYTFREIADLSKKDPTEWQTKQMKLELDEWGIDY